MAYRSGNIINADPAAALITQIEGTLDDHTGQWEFVETVTIATIDYRIWKNRGTTVTNPNAFGTDFYISINRVSATSIRFKVFESWDATNKKIIRPVQGKSSLAVNANGSYGDETNGYTADNTANLTYAGFAALATTGFDYFIQATKDQLRVALKQSTSDSFVSMGVFESLLTGSPAETFPLYLSHPGSSAIIDSNFVSSSVHYAFSRHPGIASATNVDNLKGSGATNALGPLLGGIDQATTVDKAHNNAWIVQRPSVQFFGGQNSGAPQTYGQYRGLIYDALLLANNGGSTRNGDVQNLDATPDAYVKFAQGSIFWWIKRDAT